MLSLLLTLVATTEEPSLQAQVHELRAFVQEQLAALKSDNTQLRSEVAALKSDNAQLRLRLGVQESPAKPDHSSHSNNPWTNKVFPPPAASRSTFPGRCALTRMSRMCDVRPRFLTTEEKGWGVPSTAKRSSIASPRC